MPKISVLLYRAGDGSCPFVEWVSHGIVKDHVVPPREINRAIERKKQFEANPTKHTYEEV